MVLSYALRLAAAGVALGLLGAAAMTRIISDMLFRVSPADPWTFGVIILTLVMTAILAAATPAHRATRVDPMVALRAE